MAIPWPEVLPQYVLENGYDETFADQSVESTMDSGAVRVRRRFTAKWTPLALTIMCDDDQAQEFESFYFDTCLGGSLRFTWVHPRTREPCTMQFRKPPPKPMPMGGSTRISFSVWICP